MRYPRATLLYPALIIAALAASARPGWAADDVVKIGIMADMNGPLSSASGKGSVEGAANGGRGIRLVDQGEADRGHFS